MTISIEPTDFGEHHGFHLASFGCVWIACLRRVG